MPVDCSPIFINTATMIKIFPVENEQLICNEYARTTLLNMFATPTFLSGDSNLLVNKYKLSSLVNMSNLVSIMRPGNYGNPYNVFVEDCVSRTEIRNIVVAKHLFNVLCDPQYIFHVRDHLHGKQLMCCCAPALCHGNILLLIANDYMSFLNRFSEFIQWMGAQMRTGNDLLTDYIYGVVCDSYCTLTQLS